jgi:hypothetical protein
VQLAGDPGGAGVTLWPADLELAAVDAEDLGAELTRVAGGAEVSSGATASQHRGWQFAGALDRFGRSWADVLIGYAREATGSGERLQACARAYADADARAADTLLRLARTR